MNLPKTNHPSLKSSTIQSENLSTLQGVQVNKKKYKIIIKFFFHTLDLLIFFYRLKKKLEVGILDMFIWDLGLDKEWLLNQ